MRRQSRSTLRTWIFTTARVLRVSFIVCRYFWYWWTQKNNFVLAHDPLPLAFKGLCPEMPLSGPSLRQGLGQDYWGDGLRIQGDLQRYNVHNKRKQNLFTVLFILTSLGRFDFPHFTNEETNANRVHIHKVTQSRNNGAGTVPRPYDSKSRVLTGMVLGSSHHDAETRPQVPPKEVPLASEAVFPGCYRSSFRLTGQNCSTFHAGEQFCHFRWSCC